MIGTVSGLAALLCIVTFILFGRKDSGRNTPRRRNRTMRRYDAHRRRR